MRAALVFLDDGNTIGVPAIRSQTRSIIDRHLEVVAELRSRPALRRVFVIKRRPFSGKVDLRKRRRRTCESQQSENNGDRAASGGVHSEPEYTKTSCVEFPSSSGGEYAYLHEFLNSTLPCQNLRDADYRRCTTLERLARFGD